VIGNAGIAAQCTKRIVIVLPINTPSIDILAQNRTSHTRRGSGDAPLSLHTSPVIGKCICLRLIAQFMTEGGMDDPPVVLEESVKLNKVTVCV